MKWTGVLAGVPDLAIVAPGGRAQFIEVKTAAGQVSPIAEMAAAAAIVASLALQAGCPLATLRHALDGRDVGPLGAALALIDGASP
jgi:hypothetical protein